MNTTKFEILLNDNWFAKNDVLETNNKVKFKVISTPKKHYAKWYWRLLNFLTFKLFFNVKYTYTVELID